MVERMRPGLGPKGTPVENGAPQLPPIGQNQNQNQNQNPNPNPNQNQQQQQQRNDNWAQPPPHPSDRRALTPITEQSTRDSNSWDTNANPPQLHRPGFSTVNGSPLQPEQIQKQQSETSQDLPKLQTDTESSTFLGEALVTSPTSHIPLHEFGIDRTDSAVSLGSKPGSHPSKQEPASLSKPDSKPDAHVSTDATHPAGGSISSPLSSPGKDSVFSALPSPHSNQPIHPVPSTFSDIPKTPPRSPARPGFTPPIRKGPGAESGSPTPSSSSRLQGTIQRKEAGSPSDPAATKAKLPEPSPLQQTDLPSNSPTFSPTPTTMGSPPTLTHTTTATSATSKSDYSGYSGGAKPSPPHHMQGAFSSQNEFNQNSHSHSHSTPQSQQRAHGNLGGAKPIRLVNGGKEGSGDDHDLMQEAGALYYVQEIQGAAVVHPPRIVGRGQNIPISTRKQSDSDYDDDERKPYTQVPPRSLPQRTQAQPQPLPRLPPEPSPLQVRRPSAQAKSPFPPQPPPQHSTQPSPYPSQTQYQDHGYAQSREQQPILAPQPQQPVTTSFNPVMTTESDGGSPSLSYAGSDTNPTSPTVDPRRTSVIRHGSGEQGGRPALVSRPSGARDLVQKQRAGTSDSVSSHSRHNGQLQPRHPLPPHPESSSEQQIQSSYSAYTQPSYHQGHIFSQAPSDTTQQIPQAINNAGRYPVNMANVDQRQNYEDNSDALAALTFLERDEAKAISKPPPPPPPPQLQESASPTSEPEGLPYDTPPVHITPSDSRDDVSQDSGSYEGKYRSSFAPSKQATQRLAKTQAQQAAHQAATHRPGKSGGANGKGKRRLRQDGWAESSDEEEEDDEEDDEDVDSDGDPIAPRRGQGPGQGISRLSAQGSPYGSSTDLNQSGQGRPQRGLPRPPSPGRGYGMSFLPNMFPCNPVSYRSRFPQATKTNITTNTGLEDLDRLLFVNPLDITLEASTSTIVDHLLSRTATATYGPSPISPLLELPGKQYGARRSRTRTLRRSPPPKGTLSYSLNLRKR